MIRNNHDINRRTALRSAVGAAFASVAGCLNNGGSSGTPSGGTTSSDSAGPLKRVTVEGTTLVVKLSAEADVDQVNVIQPNGEVFGNRDLTGGAQQVSFEIGTDYEPGEYRVAALNGEETVVERATDIQPEIRIQDVGLYRNNPDKPWSEVYGKTETNRLKNGEAFVTVENTGRGPEKVLELTFSGDIPNPVEDPRGNGMYGTKEVVVYPGKTVELFSDSFPFGSVSPEGMGCSQNKNGGQFTVSIETKVAQGQVSNTFDIQYNGPAEMSDCEVSITET